MTLVRWNPWNDFDAVQSELEKFFTNPGRVTRVGFRAATDVFEDDKGYTLEVDLPGVKLKDVDIELHEGTLTIAGERHLGRDEKSEGYRRVERSYGRFERSFRLPKHIDESGIEATMKEGVLRVVLPKVAEVQPRKITISG